MWITAISDVKDAEGNVTAIRVVGRGWADKLKEVEEKARVAGRNATAIEELRDRLKAQTVFGRRADDVKITGVKDTGAYMIEFTIEASRGPASADEETGA